MAIEVVLPGTPSLLEGARTTDDGGTNFPNPSVSRASGTKKTQMYRAPCVLRYMFVAEKVQALSREKSVKMARAHRANALAPATAWFVPAQMQLRCR